MTAGQPEPDERCVLICETVHDVVSWERALKSKGLWCDMIPTPRQLSSNCGMALEFAAGDLAAVRELGEGSSLRWDTIYRVNDGGFDEI